MLDSAYREAMRLLGYKKPSRRGSTRSDVEDPVQHAKHTQPETGPSRQRPGEVRVRASQLSSNTRSDIKNAMAQLGYRI
jgi:hypothetical protein